MSSFSPPLKKLGESGVGVAVAPTGGMGVALDGSGKLPWSVMPVQELALGVFQSNVTTTHTTEATADQVVACSALFFDGGTSAWLQFWCPAIGQGTTNISVEFFDSVNDGTAVGIGGYMSGGSCNAFNMYTKVSPSQGKHLYSVKIWVPGGGTGTVFAGTGNAATNLSGFLRIARIF